MNSRERMIAALECRPTDRTPVLPCLWYDHIARVAEVPYVDLLAWPERMFDAAARAREFYDTDGVRLLISPPEDWREGTVLGEFDGEPMLLSAKTGRPVAKFDLFGGGAVELLDPVARILNRQSWPVNLRVESRSDVKKIPQVSAAELTRRGQTAGIARLVHDFAGRYFVVAFVYGGFTLNSIIRLRGPVQGLMDLIDQPLLAHAIIDRCLEAAIEESKAMVDAGIDALFFGDSAASSSMISPEHYKEYCAPAYKAFISAMRAYNPAVKIYQHCCGDYNPILEMAAEEGADALHGLDPSKGMSLRDIRRRVGDKICLWGGVATGSLLSATPEEVRRESWQCIREGGPEGYILDVACALPPASPLENVHAMCQAPRTFQA